MLFSTFLGYAVKTVFFELIVYRTECARRDPLARSCSLDEPVTGEVGSATPRGELTPDHAAEQALLWTQSDAYAMSRCTTRWSSVLIR